ncbi:MAG TPA: hypothetical protein DDZ67_09405, partial [Xanthomonadaceae bacterium]|nr:hypothetical protein [Xanthomonadaceae bacterium]
MSPLSSLSGVGTLGGRSGYAEPAQDDGKDNDFARMLDGSAPAQNSAPATPSAQDKPRAGDKSAGPSPAKDDRSAQARTRPNDRV